MLCSTSAHSLIKSSEVGLTPRGAKRNTGGGGGRYSSQIKIEGVMVPPIVQNNKPFEGGGGGFFPRRYARKDTQYRVTTFTEVFVVTARILLQET